jgi:hypothetical protein
MEYVSEATDFDTIAYGLEPWQANALETLWFEGLRDFEDSPEELVEAANVLLAICGSPSRVANVMFDEGERAYSWQISRTLH